jgi:hypothetical protein
VHLSAVKNLLKRMDPSFSEKALGHRSFSDFVKAYPGVADIDETTNIVRVRPHSGDDGAADGADAVGRAVTLSGGERDHPDQHADGEHRQRDAARHSTFLW